MSIKARIANIENVFNRERDLTVCRVYGGVSFGGTIEAAFGGTTLQIADGEDLEDFIARAEVAAIEAKQSFVAITGLSRDYGKEPYLAGQNRLQ
jgi:hypothetical protein